MSTVLDLLRLSLLLGLFLACLVGLGWLLVGFLIHGSLTHRKPAIQVLNDIFFSLLSGLIINYGILLVVQSLVVSLWISGFAGLVGALVFGWALISRRRKGWKLSLDATIRWIGTLLTGILVLGPILGEPIRDWDARSIWFFQARMIYFSGTIGPAAGWQSPGLDFAHTDYPKLLAGLAAQVAQVAGFWNEYLPKLALFLMLFPVIIWLFSFIKRSYSSLLLLFLFLFGFFPNIWNGYMDGLLATYLGISVLLFGQYLQSSDSMDLFNFLACLIFLPTLKNEGMLAVLAGSIPMLLYFVLRKRPGRIVYTLRNNWRAPVFAAILFIPSLIWVFDKQRWNLVNDLQLGSAGSISRLFAHLGEGSLALILQNAVLQLQGTALLVGFLFLAALLVKKETLKISWPAILAGGIYFVGIILVYLVTPMDLNWHLVSSIDRTMLAVNSCLYVTAFLFLSRIESGLGFCNN